MLISDIQTTNMYALVVFKSDEFFYELKNWFSRKKKKPDNFQNTASW